MDVSLSEERIRGISESPVWAYLHPTSREHHKEKLVQPYTAEKTRSSTMPALWVSSFKACTHLDLPTSAREVFILLQEPPVASMVVGFMLDDVVG